MIVDVYFNDLTNSSSFTDYMKCNNSLEKFIITDSGFKYELKMLVISYKIENELHDIFYYLTNVDTKGGYFNI